MRPLVAIVDDSLTVRMDLAEAFEAAGFETVPCATLRDAREVLRERPVVLLILDILLPDGDGISFLKEIRGQPGSKQIPVLLLSSEAEVHDRVRGLTTGADEYVGKPYDRTYVIGRAQELLRKRGGPQLSEQPRVLLIDDSQTFREELRNKLEGVGYQVSVASDGEEGLRLAAGLRPNAIVVDGMMPGIDGAGVVQGIRLDAALRHTACLLLTASEDRQSELRALEVGADAFVRKDGDFTIILARLQALLRSRGGQAGPEATASLRGPKRILAIDDSATYLNEVAEALRGEGFEVVLAASGEAGLELLNVSAIDCVLLDLMMPGLSGQETCARIKATPALRDVPVIMLTALDDSGALIQGLAIGADDFITKSGDFEVLKARVRAQIRRQQFEDENRRIREQLLQVELEAMEARSARAIAEARAALVDQLERKNRELEAFSHSVSHDLRAPLRRIAGFSQALQEDNEPQLDAAGKKHLQRVRSSVERMTELIDALLGLSRVSRAELRLQPVGVAALAQEVAAELEHSALPRKVEVRIQPDMSAEADPSLLRIVLVNLMANAWKFTAENPQARVEVGMLEGFPRTYWVRDNGAGFDMSLAGKLFAPFQRLHDETRFPGTGIGLATVHRIVDRHGGSVWVESVPGEGTTFFWTLANQIPRIAR